MRHIVVMGVSGCGKTAVAEALGAHLGWAFGEGDAHHPQANVDKIASSQPLTDADRQPWLAALVTWTRARDDEGVSTVLSCSALRRRYRDVLREADPETCFVHLHAGFDVVAERMRRRAHFMPLSLLQSQFDTLEPLGDGELGVRIDGAHPLDEVVEAAERAIRRQF